MNRTSEASITVVWLVWPYDDPAADVSGSIDLDRAARTVEFDVPEHILKEQRWFAVCIAKPFKTEAAAIERFPVNP